MKRLLRASWRRLTGLHHPSMAIDGEPVAKASPLSPCEEALAASRVAFIRTDGIGDALLSAGLLQTLAEAYPHWRIQVVCPDYAASIFQNHPRVESIIPFDLKAYREHRPAFRALNDQVRSLGADLVLNTVRSRYPHTDRLSIAAQARVRIAMSDWTVHMSPAARAIADRRYTHLFHPAREGASEGAVYRDFLAWMGVDAPFQGPVMSCAPDDEAWAESLIRKESLDPSGLIILMAGALHEVRHARQYGPALRAADLGDPTIIALGAAKDRLISEENLATSGRRAINLCGTTTLGQCAALMARARLAVGAETGLAHLACAMGLPQALLIGGGHFGRFMPYSPLTTFAALPLDCYGCGWDCRHASVHCIQDIPAHALAKAIQHAWEHGRRQSSPAGFLAKLARAEMSRGPQGADLRGWVDVPCDWIEWA